MSDEREPRDIPPRFVVGEGMGEGYHTFRCPICMTDCVHHGGVEVTQGTRLTIVSHDSVCDKSIPPNGSRGSDVLVRFNCENGHEFEYRWSFHKGSMFIGLQETKDSVREGDDRESELPDFRTLWRD